jgi:hypothetical protein
MSGADWWRKFNFATRSIRKVKTLWLTSGFIVNRSRLSVRLTPPARGLHPFGAISAYPCRASRLPFILKDTLDLSPRQEAVRGRSLTRPSSTLPLVNLTRTWTLLRTLIPTLPHSHSPIPRLITLPLPKTPHLHQCRSHGIRLISAVVKWCLVT